MVDDGSNQLPAGIPNPGESGFLIPCSPNEFGSFLSGLLKIAKTVRYSRSVSFVFRYSDLVDFYNLVE